ncbi:hypothetical protein [Duodenibacillus massiliensis]|uniref:hypothetical protein n=1 Tax=Duodenibacillus massiliensis TaxID=1852381 RepID=UPI00307B61E6
MAKKTTYLIGKGGVLTVKDFEPRTFGEALEADLKKGWKKDPAKLVKAVETNPDILTAAIGLMSAAQDVIGGELDKLSSAIDAVYEKAINDGDRDFTDDEAALLDELEPNAEALDDDLEDLQFMTPAEWIGSASKKGYAAIVNVFEEFMSLPVTDGWECFSPALDTSEGAAAHRLRQIGAETSDALGLDFEIGTGIAPVEVKTTLSATEFTAKAKALKIAVETASAAKKAVKTEKKPAAKKTAAKKAAKPAKAVKKTAAKPAAKKTTVKAAAKPAVKKTAAKPATKPAVKAPAKAAAKTAEKKAVKAPPKKAPAKKAVAPKAAAKPADKPAEKPAADAKKA